ncbi:hypothetical protein ON010_g15895 [Phytophthora cinnamomi]|nr:hypothetical protein ON010_g15895 [Phytophthora cinnamomi]
MDASGDGLCVLEPALKCYIRQQFSEGEIQADSTNIRELRSAVLAALHWRPCWASFGGSTRTHIQFHIDNMSAVSRWARRVFVVEVGASVGPVEKRAAAGTSNLWPRASKPEPLRRIALACVLSRPEVGLTVDLGTQDGLALQVAGVGRLLLAVDGAVILLEAGFPCGWKAANVVALSKSWPRTRG